jgi:predicted nuclease of restriction endonuclease-like (RecB) superfamily
MKRVIVGIAAVGSVVGLLVAARRMRAHFRQMAAQCKEMMASRNGSSEAPSEREVDEIKKQRVAAPTA